MNTEYQSAPLGEEEVEARLWDYIDGLCEASEKSVIEKLIAENALWREKYAELLEVHQLVSSAELEQPSLRFTKNVMDEIARHQIAPATREYINKNIIWGIAAFFIIAIVGFVVYCFSTVDWSAGNTTSYKLNVNMPQVNYGKVFNSTYVTVFMMLNVVLGLMLLDRYLSNKKQKLIEEA